MNHIHELVWLSRQWLPMWGGHLTRGEPISDPQMRQWVQDGLIAAVEKPRPGYVITDKGRALLAEWSKIRTEAG